jgi:hypothetical protein
MTKLRTKDDILRIEDYIKTLPQIEFHNGHLFGGGMYARSLFLPKGSIVTGFAHVKEHLCMLQSGKVTVRTLEGDFTIEAPKWLVGKPFTKRVFIAHEDSVWVAIHTTPFTSVEACEATLVMTNEEYTNSTGEQLCLFG